MSMIKKFFENDTKVQANRIADTMGRFANEQVENDKAFLNVNGYVMSVRLPY